MKKLLFTSLALAALAGPAAAADLKAAYKAPPPVYVFSWTGCYIGGNFGALRANRDFTDRLVGDPFFGQTFSSNTSTWTGGVQAGCNYQFAGGFVVGIQGDYDWGASYYNTISDVFFNNVSGNFQTKNLGSVTGRIGYAWDRFLGYVKGGAAWERDAFTLNFPTGTVASLSSNTRTGWTVGIGAEYAFLNWLTGFIEYDYYGFGSTRDNFLCGAGGACVIGLGTAFPVDRKEWKSVFKVGVNVLWGPGAAPVMARY